MPECLLLAYSDALPRVRAERLRDAAQASAWPHMTKAGAREWLDTINRLALRAGDAIRQEFSWNGRVVTTTGLRKRLAAAFGGGFSDESSS